MTDIGQNVDYGYEILGLNVFFWTAKTAQSYLFVVNLWYEEQER